MELKIFSGDIHFPRATDKISRYSGILIPPGTVKTNSKESKKVKNWIYVQRITPTKKKSFVLVRPVLIYERGTEKENLKLRVVNYILYGNGKPIQGISNTSIQLVRTCLVLNWNQDKKSSSIEELVINGLIRDFLRIHLGKSPISYINRKRNNSSSSGLISDNGPDRTNTNINPFYSIYSKTRIPQSLKQNQGTISISTLLNRNMECQSLIILSSSNCFRMDPSNGVKYYNVIKNQLKEIQ
uniref:Uncharacterized protein n=1 Tax=Salix viminalis TaxID=40686 RepID=A0A6N2MX26_SALVM